MNILGVSCFFHDAAACLVQNGQLIAAASEERFTRIKHDPAFPVNAIEYCLRNGQMIIDDINYVVFYDKPFRKFDRILTTYFATYPKSLHAFVKAIPVWLKRKLWTPQLIEQEIHYDGPVLFCDHHLAHAASAFLLSPFKKAAILTIDGVGEWDTASYGVGDRIQIDLHRELRYPHSLGLLYNAFTYYLGFKVNSDEYKVMGLAPYGTPKFTNKIKQLIDIRDDGSFKLDLDYFAYPYGLRMTNERFHRLFDEPLRIPESELTQTHKDIAASIQAVTEEIVLKMARHLYQETRLPDICLAGGVALNSVANGRLLRESPFENVFIQPAAGDAGGAIGAAFFTYNSLLKNPQRFGMEHANWGPEFDHDEIQLFLRNEGISFIDYSDEQLIEKVAELIAADKIIGWFQGRMEFGPRALGNRSILANPRNPAMKDILNNKIKFREDFRPFAPVVLEEDAADYFEIDRPSPFMLLVAQVKDEKRAEIPAVTHINGSARIQTINQQQNPFLYKLLQAFKKITGCPVLVNTSFNVRGEPIVCTPREAFQCYQNTGMDYLVMGNCIINKSK